MGNGGNQAVNLFNPATSKGLSGYDQRLNNTTSAVWDIPVGRGRHFANSMPYAMDMLLGGWSFSFINTMVSHQPINLTYDPNSAFIATDGSENSAIYRPNVIGDPMEPAGQRTITQCFNPNIVLVPTDVTHPYGNAGRNIGVSNGCSTSIWAFASSFRSGQSASGWNSAPSSSTL
jgi:hypothetical protein